MFWQLQVSVIQTPAANIFAITCLIFTGDDIWRLIAEVLSCDRLAQKGSIASNGYRTPSVRLLLGQDGWVEHVDNGIRSVCKGRCFIKVCSDIKIDFSCLKDFYTYKCEKP